eukprot:gnl/TRDRNA2_/TRDRNA2_167427_c1_seq1.p1 gnl/TRDRNA2_/TRDRNA2_167427_c1~~gnl/TRDRNA2_/TRDRNA2_167427_c1_seq1.p1  ORF type:complete len:366 (-),score=47.68 gnl/TRDRNA2_/TRDRNA2_167427_c1_seq1:5-1102(-)
MSALASQMEEEGMRLRPAISRSEFTQQVDSRLHHPETDKTSAGNDDSIDGSTLEDGTGGFTVESEASSMHPDEAVRSMSGVLEVHALLGIGSFSHVYRCTIEDGDPSTPTSVAVSQIKAAVKVLTSQPSQNREVGLLLGLAHPHLVGLIRVVERPARALFLELCTGGTLHELVQGNGFRRESFLSLGTACRAGPALDVALAIEYLHSKGVMHRDIKTKNCFLTSPPVFAFSPEDTQLPPVKLGDLGCARETVDHSMTRAVGSIRSMAPEVITGQDYGVPADVFSFAVLLHELASGQAPYSSKKSSEAALAVAIVEGLRPPLDVLPICNVGQGIASLLEGSWCPEPEARPSACDLVSRLRDLVGRQ